MTDQVADALPAAEPARSAEGAGASASLQLPLLGAVALVWWLVASCSFAFDKQNTLDAYPDVANGFGVWRGVAAVTAALGLRAEAFYAVVALPFAALYVLVARRLAGRSLVLAAAFAALFLSWFGFGQLRYGTGLLLLAAAVALRRSRPRWALAALVLAVGVHPAVGVALPVLALWRWILRRGLSIWALAPIAVGYAALPFVDLPALAELVMNATGFGAYLNWLSLDQPSTVYKYVYFIGLFGAAWLAGARALKRELVLAVLMLPSALLPPFAGRGYLFMIAIFFGLACADDVAELPPPLVRLLIAVPLIVETVFLWQSDLYRF